MIGTRSATKNVRDLLRQRAEWLTAAEIGRAFGYSVKHVSACVFNLLYRGEAEKSADDPRRFRWKNERSCRACAPRSTIRPEPEIVYWCPKCGRRWRVSRKSVGGTAVSL